MKVYLTMLHLLMTEWAGLSDPLTHQRLKTLRRIGGRFASVRPMPRANTWDGWNAHYTTLLATPIGRKWWRERTKGGKWAVARSLSLARGMNAECVARRYSAGRYSAT